MRIAAFPEIDRSAVIDARIEPGAALDVDVETDWIALACEGLPRRVVVKPVGGRFVLRGLPAGPCQAWVGGRFPCVGELKLGETSYLRESHFEHFITPSSPGDRLVPSSPLMGRAEASTACEFRRVEHTTHLFALVHAYVMRRPTLVHLRVRGLDWDDRIDRVELSGAAVADGSRSLRW